MSTTPPGHGEIRAVSFAEKLAVAVNYCLLTVNKL